MTDLNIKQIYDQNPSTNLLSTDLLYSGRSPYGLTNDSAITCAAAGLAGLTSGAVLFANSNGNIAQDPTGISYNSTSDTLSVTNILLNGKSITLGGNLTTSGAFNSTFTMTATTAVTFPTTGTLATTSQIVNTSVIGTANQVLANGTSGSAQTGAVTLTFPSTIITQSAAFNLIGTGVSNQLLVTAGLAGTPTNTNAAGIILRTQGGGGGNVDAKINNVYFSSNYCIQLDALDAFSFRVDSAGTPYPIIFAELEATSIYNPLKVYNNVMQGDPVDIPSHAITATLLNYMEGLTTGDGNASQFSVASGAQDSASSFVSLYSGAYSLFGTTDSPVVVFGHSDGLYNNLKIVRAPTQNFNDSGNLLFTFGDANISEVPMIVHNELVVGGIEGVSPLIKLFDANNPGLSNLFYFNGLDMDGFEKTYFSIEQTEDTLNIFHYGDDTTTPIIIDSANVNLLNTTVSNFLNVGDSVPGNYSQTLLYANVASASTDTYTQFNIATNEGASFLTFLAGHNDRQYLAIPSSVGNQFQIGICTDTTVSDFAKLWSIHSNGVVAAWSKLAVGTDVVPDGFNATTIIFGQSADNDTNTQLAIAGGDNDVYLSIISGYTGTGGPGSGQAPQIAFPSESGVYFGSSSDINHTDFNASCLFGYNRVQFFESLLLSSTSQLRFEPGQYADMGQLSGGSLTISYTAANVHTRILYSAQTTSVNAGVLSADINIGSDIIITSDNASDDRYIFYVIIEAAI